MKKYLLYIMVLLVGTVGGVYAGPYDKPDNMSCMDHLEGLERKRFELLKELTDKLKDQSSASAFASSGASAYDPHSASAAAAPCSASAAAAAAPYDDGDELSKITLEISQTIGGKYGLSDREATPAEREKILKSIYRTRQLKIDNPQWRDIYISYRYSLPGLSNSSSLMEIAAHLKIGLETLKSHLVAVDFADCACFSLAGRPSVTISSLGVEALVDNMMSLQQISYYDKAGILKRLAVLPDPQKKTLIEELEKIAKAEGKIEPVLAKIRDAENRHTFNYFLTMRNYGLSSGWHHSSSSSYNPRQISLQIRARLKIGNAEQYWNLISALEGDSEDEVLKFMDVIVDSSNPEPDLLVACLRVNRDKHLSKSNSWTSDVCQKIIRHPDVDSGALIYVADILEELGVNPNLELDAWERFLQFDGSSSMSLNKAASAFDRLNRTDLAQKARDEMDKRLAADRAHDESND
ncbi:hypothetical protein [Candidatus Finniella inopinata]|uniref:Uncharacterized protein n=1 Tax=Candidatus Finniella inopinata TaxID=1696036 RepID=A0A4Q7DMD1_9PROT|nr:hypothetical protein [Candidatus Finniella inopinata]RZI45956.1 hypothetical protein EQU50_05865 [Candidatus Finniella inopinata]